MTYSSKVKDGQGRRFCTLQSNASIESKNVRLWETQFDKVIPKLKVRIIPCRLKLKDDNNQNICQKKKKEEILKNMESLKFKKFKKTFFFVFNFIFFFFFLWKLWR